MVENTDGVRRKPADPARLDETDRKLLGLLAEDATRSYAELGRLLHLSAPAVHERAKRLRQEGVIRATAALLDGARIGRPLPICAATKPSAVAPSNFRLCSLMPSDIDSFLTRF